MLFRAPRHFYTLAQLIRTKRDLCQCSSELHVISTITDTMVSFSFYCVNALPSSTSFLRRDLVFLRITRWCVNALPSSTSFLQKLPNQSKLNQKNVSMLFRAPRHFYLYTVQKLLLRKECVNALPSSTSFLRMRIFSGNNI